MKTTAIIVEILIIGIFASLWIILAFLKLSVFSQNDISNFLSNYSSWVPILVIIALAVFYQIGLIINGISYGITVVFFEKKVRDNLFIKENSIYEDARALVYQDASTDLRADLGTDRSIIRISRANAFNCLILSIVLIFFVGIFSYILLFTFLCSVGNSFVWFFRYKRYFRRIISAYKVIKSN